MFGERNWPIIDVSRRSIEETAARFSISIASTNRNSSPTAETPQCPPHFVDRRLADRPGVEERKPPRAAGRRRLAVRVEPADIDERGVEEAMTQRGEAGVGLRWRWRAPRRLRSACAGRWP